MEKCGECGFNSESLQPHHAKKKHQENHDKWENGIPLPASITCEDGDTLVVPAKDPITPWKLAFEMSELAQQELGYGMPSFPHPKRGWIDSWVQYRTKAYLPVRDDKVVGYAVTRMRSRWAVVDLDAPDDTEFKLVNQDELRPCIETAFVCQDYRRKGMASSLIHFIADDADLSVCDLIHMPPFTEAGLKLAEKFSRNRRLNIFVL